MPSLVAPFAGAWIEMASGTVAPSTADMSLPSRERGLKYIIESGSAAISGRSLRGSVD